MKSESKIILTSLSLVLLILGIQGCGPRAFTKGEYDDPNKVILLDDKFNENDMQLIAKDLADSLINHDVIKNAKSRPVVMVGRVKNRTSEHIDVKSLTDKIRTSLIKTGKFRFTEKEAREEVAEELDYQHGKHVDPATARKIGKQFGVEFLVIGDISSNVQEVGKDKVVYYKVTLSMLDVESNLIEWSDEREVRKRYKKRYVSD